MAKQNLTWAERFALVDHFNPSDDQIRTAFSLSQDELDTARQLRKQGTFIASKTMDVNKYAHVFGGAALPIQPTATTHSLPESAQRPARQPRKRGRKGDKIVSAFQSITSTPVPVSKFIEQHGVSLAVLRQSKRFLEHMDPVAVQQIGNIHVKQDKASKQLMIWKD